MAMLHFASRSYDSGMNINSLVVMRRADIDGQLSSLLSYLQCAWLLDVCVQYQISMFIYRLFMYIICFYLNQGLSLGKQEQNKMHVHDVPFNLVNDLIAFSLIFNAFSVPCSHWSISWRMWMP